MINAKSKRFVSEYFIEGYDSIHVSEFYDFKKDDWIFNCYTGDWKAFLYWEMIRENDVSNKYNYSPWVELSKNEQVKYTPVLQALGASFKLGEFHKDLTSDSPEVKRYLPWSECYDSKNKNAAKIGFNVNFDYSDSEIIKNFKQWLKKNRTHKQKTGYRGDKISDCISRLEGLAYMKILHGFRPDVLKRILADIRGKPLTEIEEILDVHLSKKPTFYKLDSAFTKNAYVSINKFKEFFKKHFQNQSPKIAINHSKNRRTNYIGAGYKSY